MLPKVESAAQVHFAAQLLDQLEIKHGLEGAIGLEVQIESAARAHRDRARSPPRRIAIETLIFGPGRLRRAPSACRN